MIWRLGGKRPPLSPQAQARRIQAEAQRLPQRRRAAFAAACAQRLLEAAGHSGLEPATRLINQMWLQLLAEPHDLTLAAVQTLSDRILSDGDPAFDATYDAALSASVHAGRAMLNGDAHFAAWASQRALTAAGQRGDGLVELTRQARDLRALQSALPWAAIIAALREA